MFNDNGPDFGAASDGKFMITTFFLIVMYVIVHRNFIIKKFIAMIFQGMVIEI